MGLFDRWKKSGADLGDGISPKALERIRNAFEGVPDRVSISECVPRTCVRIGGLVTAVEAAQSPNRQFKVSLTDGTAEAQLIWLGRETVPGVVPGVFLLAKGTIGADRSGELRIFDPQYSIQVDGK